MIDFRLKEVGAFDLIIQIEYVIDMDFSLAAARYQLPPFEELQTSNCSSLLVSVHYYIQRVGAPN